MAKPLRIIVPCIFPNYPRLLAQAMNLNGHEVIFQPYLSSSQSTPEKDREFLRAFEKFRPNFFLCWNMDLYDPHFEFGSEFISTCVRNQIPIVSVVVDHLGLGTTDHTFSFIKDPAIQPLMHFLCVADGYVQSYRKMNFRAEKIFMTTGFDEEPKFEQRLPTMDLSYSGTPLPVWELRTQPAVRETQPDNNELKKMHIHFFLDFWMQAFEAAGNENIASHQFETIRSIVEDYFERPIKSVSEFEEANESALTGAKQGTPSSSFEIFRKIFLKLSCAHSQYKHSVAIKEILPLGLNVYGPMWDRILKLPPTYISKNPGRDEFYQLCAASRIYFCHHKDQLMDAVNERVFVSSALGGFPLSDHREDFELLFEKNEIITYQSLEEAKDLIRYYLSHEAERAVVAARGRQRVNACYSLRPFGARITDVARNIWKLG